MIRAEIVLKDRYGYRLSVHQEAAVRRAISQAILDKAEDQSYDVARIQFFGPKK